MTMRYSAGYSETLMHWGYSETFTRWNKFGCFLRNTGWLNFRMELVLASADAGKMRLMSTIRMLRLAWMGRAAR